MVLTSLFMLLYGICFLGLLIGSITDWKTREVPDWLNYGLIASAFGIRLIASIVYNDYSIIAAGLFGFIVMLGLALLMFYTGQWGGGDSKMVMGLGALIGLELKATTFLLGFVVNLLLVGSLYGLVWSAVLAIKHRKKFIKRFMLLSGKKPLPMVKRLLLVTSLLIIVLALLVNDLGIRIPLMMLALLGLSSIYIWLFVKSVEDSCMYKLVPVEKLTEGDWIARNVRVGKKQICGPKDLGISKKQIGQLIAFKRNGKISKVLIKEGMPFVPTFLLAFAVTYIVGNLFLFVLR